MVRKFVQYWLPVIVWCGVIFYLSGIPYLKSNLGVWDLILRKLAHMTEYAVLFLLTRRALLHSAPSLRPAVISSLAFLFALLYALSDEYHQSFVPGRTASPVDVGIDTVGTAFGLVSVIIR